jgi:hypothetical protein
VRDQKFDVAREFRSGVRALAGAAEISGMSRGEWALPIVVAHKMRS